MAEPEVTVESLQKELEAAKADLDKSRKSIENLTKENAEKKRELAAKMTEQEKVEAERAERDAAIQKELEELRKEKALATGKATFLALGTTDEQASEMSKAWNEGNLDGLSKVFKTFMEERDKQKAAEALKNTPKPLQGGGAKSYTREDLDKMTYKERAAFAEENKELYAELMK